MNVEGYISFFRLSSNDGIFMFAVMLTGLLIALSFSAIPQTFGLDSKLFPIWSNGKDMPTPRTEASAAAAGDKIYVIGGADYSENLTGKRFDKLEIYDTQNNKWITSAKAMPLAIDHGVAAAYNGKIYVVGGFIEGRVPTNKLFIYDVIKDEWKEGKSMPSPRAAFGAQFVNGTLYVVGGLNNSEVPLNTMEAYDPQSNRWISKAPMPTARHHLELAVADGKLFALGGRILGDGVPSTDIEQSLSSFNRNEMYDPATDKWTVKQPMLEKLSVFGSASANSQIYIFGGEDINGGYLDGVEKYDPLSNKWTYEPPMPSKRIGLKAVTVGDKIYTIGGQLYNPESSKTGLVALNTNEILNLKNINNKK
jgi:N-acetylneuraminic acid mutarotase